MHCERYTDAIQELVDGTLGPIRRSELQIHLDQCEGCRALLQDLERIRDLAASLDRPVVPNRVWLQVAGRLRQEGRLRQPAPAASLLLAVGASLFLLVPAVRGSRQQLATSQPAPGSAPSAPDVQAATGDIAEALRLAQEHY